VCDGAAITTYWKSFHSAGTDAFLALNGMYIGIDMYTDIKLGEAFFVRSGSVKVGSYIYDEPGNDSDSRLIAFETVPPIVFSEVMAELKKIALGKAAAADD